jgi:hypothetical protein
MPSVLLIPLLPYCYFLLYYSLSKNWLLVPVFFVGVIVLGSLTGLLSKRIKTVQRSINRPAKYRTGEKSGVDLRGDQAAERADPEDL